MCGKCLLLPDPQSEVTSGTPPLTPDGYALRTTRNTTPECSRSSHRTGRGCWLFGWLCWGWVGLGRLVCSCVRVCVGVRTTHVKRASGWTIACFCFAETAGVGGWENPPLLPPWQRLLVYNWSDGWTGLAHFLQKLCSILRCIF